MVIKKVLRDNRGGTYIELMFALLALFWFLAIFVGIFPIFTKIKLLNDYAGMSARTIAMEGGITTKVKEAMKKYKQSVSLESATEDFSESEFFQNQNIQLNDLVAVKVKYEYSVNILSIPFSVPLSAKAYSRSEVYHK